MGFRRVQFGGDGKASSRTTTQRPEASSREDTISRYPTGDSVPGSPLIAAQSSAKSEDIPDSGYGSTLPSPDQVSNDKGKCPDLEPPKAIPFPIATEKDLKVFKRDTAPEITARFREIIPEIERLLLGFVKSANRIFSAATPYKPMSIRHMVLGKTEDDARDCLVIFCSADQCKRVQRFFDKHRIIKELCEPTDSAAPSFRVVVKGLPPRPRGAGHHERNDECIPGTSSNTESEIRPMPVAGCVHVHCSTVLPSHSTLCGTPISFTNHIGQSRYGTLGGIIKITHHYGGFSLCGLTAGHGIFDWQETAVGAVPEGLGVDSDDDADEDVDEETARILQELEEEDEGESDMEEQSASNPEAGADGASKAWAFENARLLGSIRQGDSGQVTRSSHYLDWAVLSMDLHSCLPNHIPKGRRKQDLRVLNGDPWLRTSFTTAVILIGASQGCQYGTLWTPCGRIMLGPGRKFTEAFMLRLDQGFVADGDSGSWVVDSMTFEVYGQVIATDVFGDAYVLPLRDILEDIKESLGAKSVELPTTPDFLPSSSTMTMLHSLSSELWSEESRLKSANFGKNENHKRKLSTESRIPKPTFTKRTNLSSGEERRTPSPRLHRHGATPADLRYEPKDFEYRALAAAFDGPLTPPSGYQPAKFDIETDSGYASLKPSPAMGMPLFGTATETSGFASETSGFASEAHDFVVFPGVTAEADSDSAVHGEKLLPAQDLGDGNVKATRRRKLDFN
ncbi:hypothetical protein G7046_g1794 [Stylonectria norvegica]|nr:hypothetical protein G7046_g1794 [Stylonectria norvegica]